MLRTAKAIVALAKRSQTHASAIRDISEAIGSSDPESTARALTEACTKLPTEAVGYIVAPAVLKRLVSHADLFQALANQVAKRAGTIEARGILLDCLHKAARSHGRSWTHALCETLRGMAVDKDTAPRLRAKATRLLAIDTGPDVAEILRLHFRSGITETCDAAAHLLHTWHVTNDPRRKGLDHLLIQWAKRGPGKALRSNGVLRALTRTSSGRQALRTVGRHAHSREQRLRLLAAGGPGLDPDILAAFIRAQADNGSLASECLLISLFRRHPEQLRLVYTKGFFAEYLYMIRRAPFLETAGGSRRIRTAMAASKAGQQSSNGFMLKAQLAYAIAQRSPLAMPDQAPALASGYETGFQMGDALYRNLITSMGNAEHWHGGIFAGFYVSPADRCEMVGINAADGIGWSDTMVFFQASKSAPSPGTDLATWMQQLRAAFLQQLADGRANHPFHGPRSTPGMTFHQRQQVMFSATSMYGMNIWWTWVDMLDYKGSGWAGTVNDIDELRCDGVMEFSYEEQGLRVCGGSHPNQRNQWNIAIAGTNHAENHNDFHNNAYNVGELCPRIQAGDQGNDSRFIVPPPVRPIVSEFGVTPWFYFLAPIIYFDTYVLYSSDVFVRLLVRKKDTGSFRIVETEDPYGGMDTPVGGWRLMRAYANQRIAAFWMGKTLGGPDFRGNDGTYEFRVQVIDQGGNISDELATEEHITWP